MENCIFCRIIAHTADAKIVMENEECIAFEDIRPKAPVHVLVMPKKHIQSLDMIDTEDPAMLGRLLQTTASVARSLHLSTNGYKVVTNIGRDAGQIIDHLHFHILGGAPMKMLV